MNLADLRTDYRRGKLEREDLDLDPIGQFNVWMKEACDFGIIEPTAMSLATVGSDGRPLLRTVLLKGVDARGFVFFTNLDSRKARQLAQNPNASLMFPWLALSVLKPSATKAWTNALTCWPPHSRGR
jgi:pyridoxamine 5'-phosphate oxidase